MVCRNIMQRCGLVPPSTAYACETLYSLGVTHPEGFDLIFRQAQKLEVRSVLVGITKHSESES
jgi:hypothetical protein